MVERPHIRRLNEILQLPFPTHDAAWQCGVGAVFGDAGVGEGAGAVEEVEEGGGVGEGVAEVDDDD